MTCTGSGTSLVCTATPLGSHIPQQTTVKVGSNGQVTTSGAGALPGGGIAMSTDGNSRLTFSPAGGQGQGTRGQNPQKTSDHTQINNKAPASAGGSTIDGDDAKKLVYGLDRALNKSLAKGTYWQDIYNAKTDGSIADWTRILKAVHETEDFFSGLFPHDYRLYFGLGKVSNFNVRLDRVQQAGSLQIMQFRALRGAAGKSLEAIAHTEMELALDKGAGKIIGMGGKLAERMYRAFKLSSDAARAAKFIAEEKRLGPIVVCGPKSCAIGN